MSSSYFASSPLPVSRNAGRQIADANRYLQAHSQKSQRPASSYSTASTSSFASSISSLKQKMKPSSKKPSSKKSSSIDAQQRKLLRPENINKAQMRMN